MTGIELISKERQEQIEKHCHTVYNDYAFNDECVLQYAAQKLIEVGLTDDDRINFLHTSWNKGKWENMARKSRLDRLIIAGALIAAEIDRTLYESKVNQQRP